jgi:ATP-binding cassette subfamily B protein
MTVASSIYEWLWPRFFTGLKKNIGTRLVAYLLHKPYLFYQGQLSGALSNKLNNCIAIIPRLIKSFGENFFSDTLALIISVYTLWHVGPSFAIALIIWVAAYLFACIRLAPIVRKLTNETGSEASKGMGHINDIIANIMNVKLFTKEVNEH